MSLVYLLIFIIGLIIGSFLNVVILRLRSGEGWIFSRSKCPNCSFVLKPKDLIPVLSFIFLKRHCRNCGEKISWQYPLVELAVGFLFTFAFYRYFSSGQAFMEFNSWLNVLRDWVLIGFLTVIFIYDLRWQEIPDEVSLPAIAVIFIFNCFLGFNPSLLLLSGLTGGLFFAAQHIFSKGRWVGSGDIRLGALMGVTLSWPGILTALMLAYISGAIVGLGLLINKKKTLKSELAFGTFLSVATLISLYFGTDIVNWYFSIFYAF